MIGEYISWMPTEHGRNIRFVGVDALLMVIWVASMVWGPEI
jgi:hypothetical protein